MDCEGFKSDVFPWTLSIVQYSKTWLVSGIGINPIFRTEQNMYFHLKKGAKQADET